MSSGRSLTLLVCVASLVVLVAGCGGSSETTAPISKAEFVKKANAICVAGQERLNAGFQAITNEQSAVRPLAVEEQEWVNRIIVPSISREVAEIRNLGAPAHDNGQVEALLAAIEDGLRKVQEDPKAVLATSAEKFAKATKRATAYGLDACAQNY